LNFSEIVNTRQSCRKFDANKGVDSKLLKKIAEISRLAPSGRNLQSYSVYIAEGDTAKSISEANTSGFNTFMKDCPAFFVIAKKEYEIEMNRDFRDIDIGILSSYITLAATDLGLSTCILGIFDEQKIQNILGTKDEISLVICVGYPADDTIRKKNRKDEKDLLHFV